MGSSSKSKTSTKNITKDIVTNNVDNRVSEGDIGGNINVNLGDSAVSGGSQNLTISTSDFGALDAASEIADQAFQSVNATVNSTQAAISKAFQQSTDAVNKAGENDATETIKYLIVGMSVVGGVYFIAQAWKG